MDIKPVYNGVAKHNYGFVWQSVLAATKSHSRVAARSQASPLSFLEPVWFCRAGSFRSLFSTGVCETRMPPFPCRLCLLALQLQLVASLPVGCLPSHEHEPSSA